MSAIRYKGEHSQFSHFYSAPITINGLPFVSAEQAYQYFKAQCARDKIVSVAIIASTDPKEIKQLSKRIEDLPSNQWDIVKRHLMYRIDYEKYSQNETLKQTLLETGSRRLIENVQADSYWGCGKYNNGQNVAGRILEQIRSNFQLHRPHFPESLVIGDSLIKNLHVGDAQILSIPGAKSWFVHKTASVIAGPQVNVLFILTGTNDLVSNEKTIQTAPKLIVDKAAKWVTWYKSHNPEQIIIMSTILPRSDTAKVDSKLVKYRDLLVQFKANAHLPYLHIFDAAQVINHQHLSHDGLHLNASGRDILSAAMNSAINSVLGRGPNPPFLL